MRSFFLAGRIEITETASFPQRLEHYGDPPIVAQAERDEPFPLRRDYDRHFKEADLQRPEIKSMFEEVSETLGLVEDNPHSILRTRKIPLRQSSS